MAFGDRRCRPVGSDGPRWVRTSDGAATAGDGDQREEKASLGVAFTAASHGAVGPETTARRRSPQRRTAASCGRGSTQGSPPAWTEVGGTDGSATGRSALFGTLLATGDGGATWTAQDSGSSTVISMRSASLWGARLGGGAAGARSRPRATVARRGRLRIPAVLTDPSGVACVDATRAWVAGPEVPACHRRRRHPRYEPRRQDLDEAGPGRCLVSRRSCVSRPSSGWAVGAALWHGGHSSTATIVAAADGGAPGRRRGPPPASPWHHRRVLVWALGPPVASSDGSATWRARGRGSGVALTGRCVFFLASPAGSW